MEHDVILGRDGVVLRPLSIRDVPPFLALVDAAGWTGMSEPLPLSDQSMRDHLRRIIDNPSGLAFAGSSHLRWGDVESSADEEHS